MLRKRYDVSLTFLTINWYFVRKTCRDWTERAWITFLFTDITLLWLRSNPDKSVLIVFMSRKRHFLHMSLKLLLFSSFFWVTHRTFKCCMPYSTTNIWKLSKHLYSILFILCRKRNANFGYDHTKYRRIFSPYSCTTNYLFLVSVSKNESFLTTTHSINHEKCI